MTYNNDNKHIPLSPLRVYGWAAAFLLQVTPHIFPCRTLAGGGADA